MRFFVRKRRPTPTVIIVALIDVLIVMLIFLMVTSTFKQQPALRLALPESSQAQKTGANEAAPLQVSIDAQGNLRFGSDQRPTTLDKLRTDLLAETAKKPELQLAIAADTKAPVGQLIKVRDIAKEANVNLKFIKLLVKESGKP